MPVKRVRLNVAAEDPCSPPASCSPVIGVLPSDVPTPVSPDPPPDPTRFLPPSSADEVFATPPASASVGAPVSMVDVASAVVGGRRRTVGKKPDPFPGVRSLCQTFEIGSPPNEPSSASASSGHVAPIAPPPQDEVMLEVASESADTVSVDADPSSAGAVKAVPNVRAVPSLKPLSQSQK